MTTSETAWADVGPDAIAILAAGDPPRHEIPLAHFRRAARLIACDGAWRTALDLGRLPDAVVGDGDSLDAADREELSRRGVPFVIEDEQATNDLCKAFRYALKAFAGVAPIVLLGATGRREDHAIGNVFHLPDFAAAHGGPVSMVTDHGVFEPVLPPGQAWQGLGRPGRPVSVFAASPDAVMASEGLAWPLDGVRFDALWRGTLNRIVGTAFSIRTNRPAVIYLPHED